MAEELRKRREDVVKYLQQMVDYTKQGKDREAKEAYQKAYNGMVGSGATRYIENVKARTGDPKYAVPVAKAALKSLNAYSKYINRKIKELKKEQAKLEKAEKKFEKLRAKLEK